MSEKMKRCPWTSCWWGAIVAPGRCAKDGDMTDPDCPMFLAEEEKLEQRKCWCETVKKPMIFKGLEGGGFEINPSRAVFCPICGRKLDA